MLVCLPLCQTNNDEARERTYVNEQQVQSNLVIWKKEENEKEKEKEENPELNQLS